MSRNKFYLILSVLSIPMFFVPACGGNKVSKSKDGVSKAERKKMYVQVSELRDRMEVVMETQMCITRFCPNSSRSGMSDLDREVQNVDPKKVSPSRLKKLASRVDVAEEIQVGLLKSSCTRCAK